MVVQARTLEFYGPYGFTGRVVEQGVVAETAHVREGGSGGSREVLSISFKEMGPGLSPYPFALAYAPLDFTTRNGASRTTIERARLWRAGSSVSDWDKTGIKEPRNHSPKPKSGFP